jgi:hypothetical protein
LNRNDAVNELNFDRINRIYRIEKEDVALATIPHGLRRDPSSSIHPVNPVNPVSNSSCRDLRRSGSGKPSAPGWFSGREKLVGKFVGLSSGNAETPRHARKARLEMLPVAEGVEFGHDFLPIPGAAQEIDEEEVALETVGIEPAEQGSGHSGVEIQAFPERPFFKLGGRTLEAFAETRSQITNGCGFRDGHYGARSWHDANSLEDSPQFLSTGFISLTQILSRNDAVKELNFDRINRIYRMEKRMWHQQ